MGQVLRRQPARPGVPGAKSVAALEEEPVGRGAEHGVGGAFNFAPNVSMYAAGKAALVSFTRSMAAGFAADGIRVNAIAPGPGGHRHDAQQPPEAVAAMANATLMKRLARPDEMVGAALLLCSAAGSYLTGQVVIVDGGGTPR